MNIWEENYNEQMKIGTQRIEVSYIYLVPYREVCCSNYILVT